MYSNAYIFRYATIMVILVAAILSAAAMLLQPLKDKNIKIDKMQGILQSVNIEAEKDSTIPSFNEYIVSELVLDPAGNIISEYTNGEFVKGDVRAFEIDMKQQLYLAEQGEDYQLPLFVGMVPLEGSDVRDTLFVVPLYGKGLWGPLWGDIAVAEDFNEVMGVYFDHKSETPGLGAEINTMPFLQQFYGKKIFDPDGTFVSVEVVKGGAETLSDEMQIHGVDAISGGTITSKGVSEMLKDCLELYVPFAKKQI